MNNFTSSRKQGSYDSIDLDNVESVKQVSEIGSKFILIFTPKRGFKGPEADDKWRFVYDDKFSMLSDYSKINKILNKGAPVMLKTLGTDLKAFITEYKSAIYMIALLFLADQILFQGAFRERLHGLMNKLLGKVEAQIEGKHVALVPEKQA